MQCFENFEGAFPPPWLSAWVSMKRFRAPYNNAYRIMRYIARNVSVRPHQVSRRVMTFD